MSIRVKYNYHTHRMHFSTLPQIYCKTTNRASSGYATFTDTSSPFWVTNVTTCVSLLWKLFQ